MVDKCPKCQKYAKMNRHHVLVRQYFGSPNNAPILLLCRPCHELLHKLIPDKLQTYQFYWDIIFFFLDTDHIRIVEWVGARQYVVRRYEQETDLQPVSEIIDRIIPKLSRQKISLGMRHDNSGSLQEA